MFVTILGLAAATLTTAALVPQVVGTWRTHRARDISLSMYLLFSLGIMLWLSYGMLINNLPIIVANSVSLMLAGTEVGFKLRYG